MLRIQQNLYMYMKQWVEVGDFEGVYELADWLGCRVGHLKMRHLGLPAWSAQGIRNVVTENIKKISKLRKKKIRGLGGGGWSYTDQNYFVYSGKCTVALRKCNHFTKHYINY